MGVRIGVRHMLPRGAVELALLLRWLRVHRPLLVAYPQVIQIHVGAAGLEPAMNWV